MSASNSQQILENTEPLRGVKHVKPTVKPKPLVPPRPKEISGSENKSPLRSPTCSPCSPTLDIPSALKISQLTGPQPYGTRRTSLKRWSSSVGEEGNQENNPLSPVENRSTDLPVKITAQPLSASWKPLQTGPVWKGKSPFMLTTRGWGEQRLNQSKDHNESETASQKPSSSSVSKDTASQKRETTTIEESTVSNSKSHSIIIPEEKAVTLNVQDSETSPEKLPSRASEDEKIFSSRFGSSNRPKLQKTLSVPLQSDLHFQNSKQVSHHDQEEIMVPSTKNEEKVLSVPIRESLHVPKSHTEDEHVKNATVYDNQIPDVGSGLEQMVLPDDISVDQGHLENRDKNHQPEAHVDPHDLRQIGDVIPKKYTQHTNTAYEQVSQHHDQQQPKNKYVTSEIVPPKPKERKKRSVQFNVPIADDQGEGQRSLGDTESEVQETKEYRGKEDENADMRRQHREDGIEEKPTLHGQQKTEEEPVEEQQGKSAGTHEPPGFVRTQIANYTVTTDDGIYREDNISKVPTDYTVSHRSECHDTSIHENIDVGQPDVHGLSLHHKEVKVIDEEKPSISHARKLYENVESGNQDIDAKHPDNVMHEDNRSFKKRKPEVAPEVKNVEDMPHFTAPSSEHRNYAYSFHDSGTPYIHLHKPSTADDSEFHDNTDSKKALSMSIESHTDDKLPSQEIYTHVKEFLPSRAQAQPQEELTELENHEPSSTSKLGDLEELECSKSKEFHLSNFEDPTGTVTQSTESRGRRDHKDGIQYYNIYSQNVQDGEKIKHEVDESEDHHRSRSQLEEPLQEGAQSEELVQTYAPSEELVYKYAPSEKPVDTYVPSKETDYTYVPHQKVDHTYPPSEELVHTYTELKEPVHTYTQSEEPVQDYPQSNEESHNYAVLKKTPYAYDKLENLAYTYEPSEEPDHDNIQTEEESHRYAVLKKENYVCNLSEKLDQTYELPEELISHNVQAEELGYRHKPSKSTTITYEQLEKPVNTYDQLKESYPEDTQPMESEKVYKHVEKRYRQPEDPPEKIIPHVKQSDESHYQHALAEETPSEFPNYQQAQLVEPDFQQPQSEVPNYLQAQFKDPNYEQPQSEVPDYQKSKEPPPYYQQEQLEEPNYQQEHSEESPVHHKPSEELIYQQEHSEEANYQQAQSEERNYQKTQPEELDFRYEQPENLENNNESSEDSHYKYYSQQSKQTSEGEPTMSGDNNHRLTESTEQEYMDLHTVETDSRDVISAKQDTAESRPEKYLEQQHRYSSPEECHHKDDSTSETSHKVLLSKDHDLRCAQQKEPQTLDTHFVEAESRDVLPEQQEHKDFDRHSQSHKSHKEESHDTEAQDGLDKHTYIEKNINGHSELEESEHTEDRSDGPRLSDEIQQESSEETASDTEETPEENNFDFLEGTSVLDTSLMRGRASLGKKRCHRTPAIGTCMSQEEADPEYWMFRDSTEPRSSPGKDYDGEEKEETSDCTPENSPSSVKSPTKKGGIFSGIIPPSILKGRLKSRNKHSEVEATKTEAKESQDPTSPGKDKSDSSSHSLNWLQALKKKKKKQPK